MKRIRRALDQQAEWVINWLRSRTAFVQLVYGTILWVPLVVLGIDEHGFLYLYIATSLSLITQVPLAMIGYRAHREAKLAEEKISIALDAILASSRAVHILIETVSMELKEQDALLEEIHEEVQEDYRLLANDVRLY
ncbi:MAG: hypothetical protein KGL39_25070 [Patescibacteria group bacterium]|nr:hypothetical protein [Patescibacteria group bacterium]